MTTPFTKLIEETKKDILKEVMQGNTKDEDYETLKRMFPELFKVIADDIEKTISLTLKQAEKIFNENLDKIKERLIEKLKYVKKQDAWGYDILELDYEGYIKKINSVISEFQSPKQEQTKLRAGSDGEKSLQEYKQKDKTAPADTLNSMEKKE